MNSSKAARLLTRCAFLSAFSMLLAANWPQWRGPERDGVSKESGLLQQWPEGGPKLVWQVSGLGDGYSTPSVVGNRIYLINNEGLENEFVQALDTKDGSRVWTQRVGNVGNPGQQPSYPSARSTPTLDGELLFALGSDGDLVCMEAATGEIRWHKHLRNDFGGKPGEWAYSESPLVDGDVVVVTPGGKEATLLALNKNTSEVVWKAPVPEGDDAAYASAIVVNAAGRKQYVQFLAKGLVGVDANTGEFLWRFDKTANTSPANIGTPVARGADVYSGTHFAGGGLVRLSEKDGEVVAEEIYSNRKLPTAIGGSVLVGDYLYGTNRTSMVCVDFKTGEIKWTQERGLAPASLCYADGRLYVHSEGTGEVALVEASPEEYREHGRFMPMNAPEGLKGKSWTYPVVADGRFYIHNWGTLWCWDVRAENTAR